MTEAEKNLPDSTAIDLLQKGQRLHEAGQLLEASKCYQTLLQKDPRNTEALLSLSLVARQSEQHLLSLQVAQEVVRINPDDLRHLMNLAHAYRAIDSPLEAIHWCEKVLEQNPQFVAAHCVLGDILYSIGEKQSAREHYLQAVQKQPDFAHAYCCLGNMECQEGNDREAIPYYSQAVDIAPEWAEAYFALGYALHQVRDRNGAITALRRALELKPHFPAALLNLGNLFYDYGEMEQAAAIYRLLVRMDPRHANGYCNLGNTLAEMNKLVDAYGCYQTALLLEPDSPLALHKLGNLLIKGKEWEEAERCFQKTLEKNPTSAEAHNDFGNLFFHQRKLPEAAEYYRKAIALKPTLAVAQSNLGNALQDMGYFTEAIVYYEKSVELDPTSPGAHYNLSLAQLCEGDYRSGWKEYEWRWEFDSLRTPRRPFKQPLWQGQPLQGRRILLHAEQGLGDTLQFVRYIPLIAARGGHVILEVPPTLHRLLSDFPGVSEIVSRGSSLPFFDYQCPLMSLPLAFETTIETIPAEIPYLKVPSIEVAKAKAACPAKGLRVGLTWAGNPKNKRDDLRSLPLKTLQPLSKVPGISFFAIQQGPAVKELAELAADFPIDSTCCAYSDFLETAALVETLDLVISVDTAVVHLMGAMGKPIWVLLPYIPDWRWMRNRSDNAWYPTARLFRQSKSGDWEGVVEEVAEALSTYARENYRQAPARQESPLPWSGGRSFTRDMAAF